MTDRRTDGQTGAREKTICLPTLSGGDINITSVSSQPILSDIHVCMNRKPETNLSLVLRGTSVFALT